MKSVLISTRPKWCEKICHKIGKDENGKPIYEKRIEVRKSAPGEVPFKAYIYATKPKRFYKCGAVSTSDELLWLANGKVEMGDGFKFWADGDEYQCLNGRVIGEFICDKVIRTCGWRLRGNTQRCAKRTAAEEEFPRLACLTIDEIVEYSGSENLEVAGLHISDLKIYDKPKELSEFISSKPKNKFRAHGDNLTHPPQSWQYVEDKNE